MLRRPKHALYSAVAVPVASKDTFGATNAILFQRPLLHQNESYNPLPTLIANVMPIKYFKQRSSFLITIRNLNTLLLNECSLVHRLACSMATVGENGEDFCVLIYVKHSTNQTTLSNTGYRTDYLHICFL